MSGWVVALIALSLAAPARGDSLQVATAEPALGEEIARAARRYVSGPISVRGLATRVDPAAARKPCLTVRMEAGQPPGQLWSLVLWAPPNRQVRRTLRLREAPSRFDLAEAVAIGLPDMLARLAEQPVLPAPHPALPPHPATPVPRAPIPSRVALASAARLPSDPRLPPLRGEPAPMPERALEPHRDAPPPAPAPVPAPPAPPTPPAPLAPASPKPAAPSTLPAPLASASPKPARPSQEVAPAVRAAKEAPSPDPPPASPVVPSHTPRLGDEPHRRSPPPAIGLAAGGGALLLAGIGTGVAAMVTAQQVDTPPQMHFDRDLDNRGKALGTATLVLDSVGAVALVGGSAWLLANALKSRRSAPRVMAVPVGQGLVVGGRF
jgi:hypothetical protein